MLSNREVLLGSVALGGAAWYHMNRNFKYFKYEEFADKLSGANRMQAVTIKLLDKAREIAKVPFIVNSGYRDENHPETIKNPTSSHYLGFAVDIRVTNETRDIIESALRQVGFNRIGLANGYIHADNDPNKTQFVTWFYNGRDTLYNQKDMVYFV